MLDERDMELLRALFREEGERIEQRINQRMDERFQVQDGRIDELFQAQDERIDEMFQAQDEKIGRMFQEQRRSIMHDVQVLMDAEFKPRFDLLAEDLQIIREKMIPEERMEEAEADIQVLKTSVRMLSEDVRALKKAQ